MDKIYSTNCDVLLDIKKNLDNKLSIEQFEFFWINGGQIKWVKDTGEKCIVPIQTSIIDGNKIAYSGYLELKTCVNNDPDEVVNVF
jgi:hypothetical protein